VFWSGPVCELAPGTDPEFGLLQERDFAHRRANSSLEEQQEYLIKHALTREVAYASLLKARRAPLHAGFAQWLERNGNGEDEHAPLLAHHYAEAVRPEVLDLAWSGREGQAAALRGKAVWWSRRAAELAIGRYEIDQGLALLNQAVGLETDPRDQAGLWQRIGHACALKYDGEGFWQAMHKALEIGGPSAEVYAELALQCSLRAGMWVQQPDWALVDGWIQQAMELAEEGSLTQGKALAALAMNADDESASRSALAIAERLGDQELRCTMLHNIAYTALLTGDFDQACTLMDEVMALLPGLPNPDVCSTALMSAVFIYLKSGRLVTAARASEQAAWASAGATPHHRVHAAAWQLILASATGRWDQVQDRAAEAEQVVDANLAAGTPCCLDVSILLNCATGRAQAGEEDEARRLEAKANGLGMEGGRWYQGWFEPPKIRLALARHQTGTLTELTPGRLRLGVGAGCDLPGCARRARRLRPHRSRSAQLAAAGDSRRAVRAPRPRHRPRRSGAPPAGAPAVRGDGTLLAGGADQATAERAVVLTRLRGEQAPHQSQHAPPRGGCRAVIARPARCLGLRGETLPGR
jgi:hypothetical protein